MKIRIPDKYYLAAIILLAASSVFIILPLFIHVGDATTAAFILAGMVFVMAGSFVFILSGGEPVDPGLVGILPAQGSIALCRIASEAGISGKAHFLPPRYTGSSEIMQLNPETDYDGSLLSTDRTVMEREPRGFLTQPSGGLLVRHLKEKNALVIPGRPEEIPVLLNETVSDTLEFATRVSVALCDDQAVVTLHGYELIAGCRVLAEESPGCCSRYPCPVCSLCGILIAGVTDQVTLLEACSCAASARDVTITFRITSVSLKQGDTGPGNSH